MTPVTFADTIELVVFFADKAIFIPNLLGIALKDIIQRLNSKRCFPDS